MTHQVVWSWPIVAEQSLFGFAAGTILVAAALSIWGKRQDYFPAIRVSYVTAAIASIIGLGILVLELGRPERASLAILNWLTIGTSVMSKTVPLLGVFTALGVVTGGWVLFLPGSLSKARRYLEFILLLAAIGGGMQAGLLLQAATFRGFWQTPFFPYIYLLTGILAGIGFVGLLLGRNFDAFREAMHNLVSYSLAFVVLTALGIAAHLVWSWNRVETYALLTTVQYGFLFYVGVILLGILIPGAMAARVVWTGILSKDTGTTIFLLFIIGLIAS